MQAMEVNPPLTALRLPDSIVSLCSKPGSRKWQCISTRPGITYFPLASIILSAVIPEQSPVFTENTESADAGASYTQSAQAAGDNKGSESSVSFPLDLNTCTAAQLMQIDGIGEVRASAIIAYRNELGGYTSVEQLKNIKGIGEATFAKIAPYVTV